MMNKKVLRNELDFIVLTGDLIDYEMPSEDIDKALSSPEMPNIDEMVSHPVSAYAAGKR